MMDFVGSLHIFLLEHYRTIASIVLVIALTYGGRFVQILLTSLASRAINGLLLKRYPIRHNQTGRDLPSLPYIFPNGQGNVEKFLHGRTNSAKWEGEYGSVYRLWSGMKSEIVLTKPAHVESVFSDSHLHTKAHANDSGYLMDRLLGSCLGLISGKPWNAVKSAVEAPFLHSSISAYVYDVQQFTKLYMANLTKENVSFRESEKLHPVHDLKLLPFLLVTRVVYGPLESGLERELEDLIPLREDLFKSVIAGGVTRFSFSRFLPFSAVRALLVFQDRWARWSDRAYQYALQKRSGETAPIISMYKSVQEGKMTREQLLQTLDEMLFANIDVTMGGLSWTLVFLATHSEIQRELREEIRACSTEVGIRNDYLLSTRPTLLRASLLESSRLRPLAAFSVPQSCPTPRVLDGFEIPAGTNFVIDSYALNIRDPFWGEDREKFRPQRWLEKERNGRDLRYRYWRYGFGPRTCLGKYVADLILRSVVVEILENWHITMETVPTEQEKGKSIERSPSSDGENEMEWPWNDEMWIHHPDLLLRCRPLKRFERL